MTNSQEINNITALIKKISSYDTDIDADCYEIRNLKKLFQNKIYQNQLELDFYRSALTFLDAVLS